MSSNSVIFNDAPPARLQPGQYVVVVDPDTCGLFANKVVESGHPYRAENGARINYIDLNTAAGQRYYNGILQQHPGLRGARDYPIAFRADANGRLHLAGRGADRALDAIMPELGRRTPDRSMEICPADPAALGALLGPVTPSRGTPRNGRGH